MVDESDVTEKRMFGGLAFLVAGHMHAGPPRACPDLQPLRFGRGNEGALRTRHVTGLRCGLPLPGRLLGWAFGTDEG